MTVIRRIAAAFFLQWSFLLLLGADVVQNHAIENPDPSIQSEKQQIKTPPVLFLKGSPYELGYQHGKQLKEAIGWNLKRLVDDQILANPEHPQIKSFLESLPRVIEHVSEDYKQELKGLAEGSQLPYDKLLILNLFPEMFHCTGITVAGKATLEEELYHVRVLDYAMGQGLQDTAVLMVFQPQEKHSFLTVSYAGFIGCVTGMNVQHIAIGEIGGKGYGRFDGIPMAFLLRTILEQANNLEDVKQLLTTSPRTCEYYYVFSDGKNRQSIGVYATDRQLQWIEPGLSYALFDQEAQTTSLFGREEKTVFDAAQIEVSPYQTVFYKDRQKQQLWGLVHQQPADCLLIIGFAHPKRYPILIERLLGNYGKIDVEYLQQMIKYPVSRPGNLHNAIFAPASLDVWVAHMGLHGEPACEQPYMHFNLTELLKKEIYQKNLPL